MEAGKGVDIKSPTEYFPIKLIGEINVISEQVALSYIKSYQ